MEFLSNELLQEASNRRRDFIQQNKASALQEVSYILSTLKERLKNQKDEVLTLIASGNNRIVIPVQNQQLTKLAFHNIEEQLRTKFSSVKLINKQWVLQLRITVIEQSHPLPDKEDLSALAIEDDDDLPSMIYPSASNPFEQVDSELLRSKDEHISRIESELLAVKAKQEVIVSTVENTIQGLLQDFHSQYQELASVNEDRQRIVEEKTKIIDQLCSRIEQSEKVEEKNPLRQEELNQIVSAVSQLESKTNSEKYDITREVELVQNMVRQSSLDDASKNSLLEKSAQLVSLKNDSKASSRIDMLSRPRNVTAKKKLDGRQLNFPSRFSS